MQHVQQWISNFYSTYLSYACTTILCIAIVAATKFRIRALSYRLRIITMVSAKDLGDAAIAIRESLDELGVQFGIFGGYAIAALGGPRESKDIDCVVSCEKQWLVERLKSRSEFRYMANSRKDLAAFLYGDRGVLVEFFPSK